MTKQELIELLTFPNIPLSEGTPEDKTMEASVRIHFWEYIWEPLVASGAEYNTKVTYQVSIISDLPRCKELLQLKHRMDSIDLHPVIQIEYDVEERRWHSFFSIEVLENV